MAGIIFKQAFFCLLIFYAYGEAERTNKNYIKKFTLKPIFSTIDPSKASSPSTMTTQSGYSPNPSQAAGSTSTLKPFTSITSKPAESIKYKMKLTDSGPAVLDSKMTFTATLIPENITDTDDWPLKFKYEWLIMGRDNSMTTEGHLNSTLEIDLDSDLGDHPGEFVITVAAFFKHQQSKLASFSTIRYLVTEELNGDLALHQKLLYQRLPNVFSTQIPITLEATVSDDFQALEKVPTVYRWYKVSNISSRTLLDISLKPVFSYTFSSPGNFILQSDVKMIIEDPDFHYLTNNVMGLNDEDCLHKHSSNVKCGGFKQSVFFKDPLQHCLVIRKDARSDDYTVKVGESALLQITCLSGSGPTGVCSLKNDFNETFLKEEEECTPTLFIEGLHHQFNVQMNMSGWNNLTLFIYNDISRSKHEIKLYAYDPDDTESSAMVVPTIFIVLGVLVLTFGTVYILKIRRKTSVEVADFDFHPGLTKQGKYQEKITKLAITVKHYIKSKLNASKTEYHRLSNPAAFQDSARFGYDSL